VKDQVSASWLQPPPRIVVNERSTKKRRPP